MTVEGHSHDDSAELDEDIAACRQLVASLGPPGTPADDRLADHGMADQLSQMQALLAEERGPQAKLKSLPSAWQMTLLGGLAAALTLVTAVAMPRFNLAQYPTNHMALVVTTLMLLVFFASRRLLRPLHLPPANALGGQLLVAVGIVAPFALLLVPLSFEGGAPGEGMSFLVACLKCLTFGAVLGLPVLFAAVVARRSAVGGVAVAALAGVAAGLTGNLALQVHCPITDTWHILLGHAPLLLVFTAVAVLWRRSAR